MIGHNAIKLHGCSSKIKYSGNNDLLPIHCSREKLSQKLKLFHPNVSPDSKKAQPPFLQRLEIS